MAFASLAFSLVGIGSLGSAPVVTGAPLRTPGIIPLPNSVQMLTAEGPIVGPNSKILLPKPLAAAGELKSWLKKRSAEGSNQTTIQFFPSSDVPAEGYRMHTMPGSVLIAYGDEAGAFYAIQTLKQLGEESTGIPSMIVEDAPRFGWRGMHLDTARHMQPVKEIERYLDALARYKFNTFHWHLVDDHGWRMESKRYPMLTKKAAYRVDQDPKSPNAGWDYRTIQFAERGYGGYYTQAQIKHVIAYAAARNITVMPEIEMPGHSLSVIAGYPELGCENQPPSRVEGRPDTNAFCAGKEETFKFLENLLDETMELFPSKFIHIGGDELDKTPWKRCTLCQARMKKEGLKDENELQSYFIKRIERYLNSKGRRMIGWDEILEGGLAPNAAVMSWRGISGGIEAANSGHDVVMSPTSHCYFDYPYNNISTEVAYGFDPVPEGLDATAAKHILGGQANVWTEMIPTAQRFQFMVFPRMIGLSEALWTQKANKDWNDFQRRLDNHYSWLDATGRSYYIPTPQPDYNAVMLEPEGSLKVSTRARGFQLVYELDGKLPSLKSPVFPSELKITKPTRVTMAYISKSGVMSEPIVVDAVAPQKVDFAGLQRGLKAEVYAPYENNKLTDVSKLKPVQTFIMPTVGLDQVEPEDFFLVKATGYAFAPVTGNYTFRLKSDDGSKFWIAGAMIIDNDGLHGAVEKSGKVWLKQGIYPIEVQMFESGGAQVFELTGQFENGPIGPIAQALLHRP